MDNEDFDYSDSYSYRALAAVFVRKLEEQINQQITNLIAAPASSHDKIAGMIMGLQKAKSTVEDQSKRFARDDKQQTLQLVTLGESGSIEWGV